MMARSIRAGACLAAIVTGTALFPAGAGAAATGWRITHTNDVGTDNQLDEVVATGANPVWAVGSVHRYEGSDHWYEPLLQRYDGNSWQWIPGTRQVLGVGSVDLVNDPNPLKHEAGVFRHG